VLELSIVLKWIERRQHMEVWLVLVRFIYIFYRLGYSNLIVVVEHFVLKIPKNLSLDRVAPLLCAGITVYSALRQHNVGKDTRIG
jgi:NADPH:quinone reductase-like Zn-dependent oxidoreductase